MIIKRTSITPEDKLRDLLSYTITINECKIWIGAVNTDGYAAMAGNVKVHRLSYELSSGENINGKVIRHKCDNPLCINPNHLESGSHSDNMRDRDNRERHGAAKLSHKEVFEIVDLLDSKLFYGATIAKWYGIDPRTVSGIKKKTHWKHLF